MRNKITVLLFLLIVANSAHAQFSFHWAFPYYSLRNMEIRNGNSDFLVITKDKSFNGFPLVEHKPWGKNNRFIYLHSVNKFQKKSYIFVCVDGTIALSDILKLHKNLPKSVIFFIHREKSDWGKDLASLKKILEQRPGWAYGGDPYNPAVPILRSNKTVFTKHNIILGNQAPGEGLR